MCMCLCAIWTIALMIVVEFIICLKCLTSRSLLCDLFSYRYCSEKTFPAFSVFSYVEQFTGYDVGNKLIHLAGITSTLYPDDGSQILTERIQYLHGNWWIWHVLRECDFNSSGSALPMLKPYNFSSYLLFLLTQAYL